MADDTNKVKLLYELSFDYQWIDSDKGEKYGEMQLALGGKLEWEKA